MESFTQINRLKNIYYISKGVFIILRGCIFILHLLNNTFILLQVFKNMFLLVFFVIDVIIK